jgi:AraC-like DNA-binding protein
MISKHFHNEYEIYYLLEGERYYFIDNQTYYVKKGSMVFIDRNKIHKTAGANTHYHDRILIQFLEDDVGPLLSMAFDINIASFFSKHFGILELNDNGQRYVENLIFGIIDEMRKRHTSHEYLIRAKLAELLIFAIRCKKGENTTFQVEIVKTEKHRKIHEIADYITQNYDTKISLEDLSKHFFVSKCYLSRIFKEVTGFTVNEYINIVRITKAQVLLESMEYSITEIAEMLGYDSITYFEKVFKKYIEKSPLKYRKKFAKK